MRRRSQPPVPWGRILGLLMAVTVTLICVVRGVEPVVILKRSIVAFLIVSGITAVVIYLLQNLDRRRSETSR